MALFYYFARFKPPQSLLSIIFLSGLYRLIHAFVLESKSRLNKTVARYYSLDLPAKEVNAFKSQLSFRSDLDLDLYLHSKVKSILHNGRTSQSRA